MSGYTPGAVAGSISKNAAKKGGENVKLLALFSVDIPKPERIKKDADAAAKNKERKRKRTASTEGQSPKKSKAKENPDDSSLKDSTTKEESTPEEPKLIDRTQQRENRKKKKKDPEKEKRTIFVGNIPNTATRKQLTTFFKKYGAIESIRFRSAAPSTLKLPKKAVVITKSFHPQLEHMNGYVVFEEKESAVSALKSNGELFEGKFIQVDLAKTGGKKHDHSKSVFIGNLPFTTQDDDLREHFEDCGSINNVRIIRDGKTGLGKGFGYILFEDKDGVDFALTLNESVFKERKLRVLRAEDVNVKGKKNKKKKNKTTGQTSSQQSSPNKMTEKKERVSKSFSRNVPSNIRASEFQGVKAKRTEKVQKRKKQRKEKIEAKKNALILSGTTDKSKDGKTKKIQDKIPSAAIHKNGNNETQKPTKRQKGDDSSQVEATQRKPQNKAMKGFKPKGGAARSRMKKKMRKSKFTVKTY